MSAKKEVYSLLTANAELVAMLAKSNIPGSEALPAIYDVWPGENAPMPYIICSWSFPEGRHWAQVAGNLDLDIYTNSGDTTEAETIKNKALEVLAWQRIRNATEGQINIYFGGFDEEIPEPEPQVTHWQINFLVKFWRQNLIAAITQQ
jgi:hypothetical protein